MALTGISRTSPPTQPISSSIRLMLSLWRLHLRGSRCVSPTGHMESKVCPHKIFTHIIGDLYLTCISRRRLDLLNRQTNQNPQLPPKNRSNWRLSQRRPVRHLRRPFFVLLGSYRRNRQRRVRLNLLPRYLPARRGVLGECAWHDLSVFACF